MKGEWKSIKSICPLIGAIVLIKTNWSEYLATLQPSKHGGVAFKVLDGRSKKTVQLTTVTGWHSFAMGES